MKAGCTVEILGLLPVRVRITAVLRKAIYSGEYQSGEEFSLTDIAAQWGISRTPVREAFQVLENESLITLRMNKGAIVNNIDRKFIRDILKCVSWRNRRLRIVRLRTGWKPTS